MAKTGSRRLLRREDGLAALRGRCDGRRSTHLDIRYAGRRGMVVSGDELWRLDGFGRVEVRRI
jgi:hypothetical protein